MGFDSGPEVVRVNQNYVLTEYVQNENDCTSIVHSCDYEGHQPRVT